VDRMGTVICVDVGNINIHTGLFLDGKLTEAFDDLPRTADLSNAEAIVYSSVSEKNFKKLSQRLKEVQYKGRILHLSSSTQNLLKIHYKNPSQLGDDRLALAYYIWRRYGEGLGIDAGTFINIEWVKDNTHFPIAIFPGLELIIFNYKKGTRLKDYPSLIMDELKKMRLFRSKGRAEDALRVLPESSIDCIVKGIVDALKGLVDGALRVTGEERVIFTGGDGEILSDLLNFGKYEKHAVLWGLYYFFEVSESSSKF